MAATVIEAETEAEVAAEAVSRGGGRLRVRVAQNWRTPDETEEPSDFQISPALVSPPCVRYHQNMHSHDAHGHAQDHGHGFADEHRRGRDVEQRRLKLTMAITFVILLVEVAGGIWSHSLALSADAVHMFSDVAAQALALAAMVIAALPADERRTYGWHRIEILAALVNGLLLLGLCGFIIWRAILRLHAPPAIETHVMLAVTVIGLIANLVAARILHSSTSLTARSAYLHLVMDLLSSVAVLSGGIAMTLLHGAFLIDPILSMVIGLFVLYSAYRVLAEAVDVLLETVPRNIDLAGVTHAMDRVEGVTAVHDLHIWTITTGMIALSAHIVVAADHADRDQTLNRIKHMLLHDFKISHTTLQIEAKDHPHVGHVC